MNGYVISINKKSCHKVGDNKDLQDYKQTLTLVSKDKGLASLPVLVLRVPRVPGVLRELRDSQETQLSKVSQLVNRASLDNRDSLLKVNKDFLAKDSKASLDSKDSLDNLALRAIKVSKDKVLGDHKVLKDSLDNLDNKDSLLKANKDSQDRAIKDSDLKVSMVHGDNKVLQEHKVKDSEPKDKALGDHKVLKDSLDNLDSKDSQDRAIKDSDLKVNRDLGDLRVNMGNKVLGDSRVKVHLALRAKDHLDPKDKDHLEHKGSKDLGEIKEPLELDLALTLKDFLKEFKKESKVWAVKVKLA